jgi:hypothetical protein
MHRIQLQGYDAPVAEIGRREHTVSSEAEENKALVRHFLEAHAKGDLAALGEMLAPDFVDHSLLPGQEPARTTREGYLRSLAEQHAAFSDIRYIIEYQATDGDMVISRITMCAIHDRGRYLAWRLPARNGLLHSSSSTASPGARSSKSGARGAASQS